MQRLYDPNRPDSHDLGFLLATAEWDYLRAALYRLPSALRRSIIIACQLTPEEKRSKRSASSRERWKRFPTPEARREEARRILAFRPDRSLAIQAATKKRDFFIWARIGWIRKKEATLRVPMGKRLAVRYHVSLNRLNKIYVSYANSHKPDLEAFQRRRVSRRQSRILEPVREEAS